MLWIYMLIISVLVFGLCIFIYEKTESDILVGIGVFAVIFGLVGIVASLIFFIGKHSAPLDFANDMYNRELLIQKGELLSQDNSEAIYAYISEVQKFNKELQQEKNVIIYRGNLLYYHSRDYLSMEPINIDKFIVNTPTSKIILEK